MRLFIAVNLDEDSRRRLAALRDTLRSRSTRGRFTISENLHLTVAFLGECDPMKTNKIKDAMDSIQYEPFSLSIDRVGRFRRDGGDIWWAGTTDNETLKEMRSALVKELKAEGIDIEERFDAHITVAREVCTDERPHEVEPFTFKVDSVDLMRSERIDGILTYTVIHTKGART